jgi:hypothetical protein
VKCEDCPFMLICWSGLLDHVSYCLKCKRIYFHLSEDVTNERHKYVTIFTCSERWAVLMLSEDFYSKRGINEGHTRFHKDPMVPENEIKVQDCWLCKFYTKEAIATMFQEEWLELDDADDLRKMPT